MTDVLLPSHGQTLSLPSIHPSRYIVIISIIVDLNGRFIEKIAKSTSSLRHRRIVQWKRESLKFCCIDSIKNIAQVKYKTDIIWEFLII